VPYIRNSTDRVFCINVLNIILKEGYISKYQWNNSCLGCGGSSNSTKCTKEKTVTNLDENKYDGIYNQDNCYVKKCDAPSSSNCDPRIFVTWSGTDVDKKYLTSAGMGMTFWADQDVGSLWKSMEEADVT